MFVIHIITDRSRFDINVTPDKRTVLIQQMPDLLSALRAALSGVWDPSKWQYSQSLGEYGALSSHLLLEQQLQTLNMALVVRIVHSPFHHYRDDHKKFAWSV
jgi:DNA mismatch repair ATPase MutL